MRTARIVIYIVLALSIGAAALAQHNGQTNLTSSTSAGTPRSQKRDLGHPFKFVAPFSSF
jgi:hypothetical protein